MEDRAFVLGKTCEGQENAEMMVTKANDETLQRHHAKMHAMPQLRPCLLSLLRPSATQLRQLLSPPRFGALN